MIRADGRREAGGPFLPGTTLFSMKHDLRSKPAAGRLMLFLCALIWGSGYVAVKSLLDGLPPMSLLTVRFGGCALVLSLVFVRRLKGLNRSVLLRGIVAGALQAAAFGIQIYGLMRTTTGKNAFLTAVYCPLVPFVLWAWKHRRPRAHHVLGGVLCMLGIGLISLDGSLRLSAGDALSLLGGVVFAVHVALLSEISRESDPVLLTIVQAAVSSLCFLAAALISREALPVVLPAGFAAELVYLILFPTSLCVLLQNVGQSITPPAAAAILLSLESPVGAALSVLLLGDRLTPRLLAGFAVVFAAVLVSELEFPIRKEKNA